MCCSIPKMESCMHSHGTGRKVESSILFVSTKPRRSLDLSGLLLFFCPLLNVRIKRKEKGFRTVMKIKMKSTKTISEIFSLFELEKKAAGVAEVTLKGYRVNCERLIAYTGDISMDSLTKEEIEKYFVSLRQKEVAPRTIQSYTSAVVIFLNWANEAGYCHIHAKAFKAPETQKQTYTDDELARLLKKPNLKSCNFATYRTWVIINLLMDCGCRAGTVRELKIEDIDFDNSMIHFSHTKNKKALSVPFSSRMGGILKEYLGLRGGEKQDYVFPTENNTQLERDSLSESIRRYNRARGVELGSTHALRHTFCKKYLLDCGGNAFTLQKLLGHSTLDATKHYCASFNADLVKNYDEFSPLAKMNQPKEKIAMR